MPKGKRESALFTESFEDIFKGEECLKCKLRWGILEVGFGDLSHQLHKFPSTIQSSKTRMAMRGCTGSCKTQTWLIPSKLGH